ncbi:unnamed protein product [Eruca vesicaria subsp. sativa]|uniref:RNase H type-1 domain-containing protein n=1 Tax=Eruca vesicaria subsp. sativa TaxID=29727 RepID=A0ABC8KIA6_ERUVS|nr:unnamed protein product [Eruca vesicaria subsp. sativa]
MIRSLFRKTKGPGQPHVLSWYLIIEKVKQFKQKEREQKRKHILDAARDASRQAAGLGWILLSNPHNVPFKEQVEFVPSSLMAEALALCETVFTCQRLMMKLVRFESDYSQLIKIVNSGFGNSGTSCIVTDVIAYIFDFICFVWIPQERNTFADVLAKDALNASGQQVVDGALNALN